MNNADFHLKRILYKIEQFLAHHCRQLVKVNHWLIGSLHKLLPNLMLFLCVARAWCTGVIFYNSPTYQLSRANQKKILAKAHCKAKSVICYETLRKMHLKGFFFGNPTIELWLNECSAKLLSAVKQHETKNKSILFAPMHVYSDEFAILVASRAVEQRLDVISVVGNAGWDAQWGLAGANKLQPTGGSNPKVGDLNLVNIFELNNRTSSLELLKVVKSFKAGASSFAIFVDALPEYTARWGKQQKLKKVTIFNKIGHMHAGPFELAKRLDCLILPYYVCYRNGKIDIEIFDALGAENIEVDLIRTVESAITKEHSQWIFWHFMSFFYFNG